MFEGQVSGNSGSAPSTLTRKGLIIIAVPAIFQLIVLAALFELQRSQRLESASESRKKEIVTSAYRLQGLLSEAENGMRGYLLTEVPRFLEPYERAMREIGPQASRLRFLVQADGTPVPIDEVERRAVDALAFQTENRRLATSGTREQALDRIRKGVGKARMDAFRDSIRRLVDNVRRGALHDAQRAAESQRQVNAALAIGTMADVAICVALMMFFSRGLAQRLSAVSENTRRIERNEPLLPALDTNDEIGNLDRRVHEMAAALERARGDLDSFFTVSVEMLCIAGFDGYFKRLNPAWSETLGYSLEELYSRPWLDFVHPDDREATIAVAQCLFDGKLTIRFENRYRHADGSYRWIVWNAAPVVEKQLIYAAASDITERKRVERILEEANQRLRVVSNFLDAIIDHIPDMVFVKDAERLAFERVNRAAEELIGLSQSELRGKTDFDFFPKEEAEFFRQKDRETLATGVIVDIPEEPLQTTKGTRWLHTKKVAIKGADGRPTHLLGISSDITERKAAEEAARAANQDLESFSYSVSHDLRAPLRAVDGYARILEEDYSEAIGDEGRRLLGVIRSEARRMGLLIDDLLAFSQLGRQSLARTAIDVHQLCEEVMREVKATRPERVVSFENDGAPPAFADRSTLRQVLVNLLSNAVKYAKPDGAIRVEFGGRRENDHNVYWVRDNGIGFDMRYAEKIFGVFQRLHDNRQFEGTGVGLAIVERIIRRHAGRVWADGKPGEGATFFFTLPSGEEGEVTNE